MAEKNIIYVHRFHRKHRVSLNGTRLPIEEVFTRNIWMNSTILLEDENTLVDLTSHTNPEVSALARRLQAFAAGFTHPLINTVAGHMRTANTWACSRYTDEQIALAERNPSASFKEITEYSPVYGLGRLLMEIAGTISMAGSMKLSDPELFAHAHNVAVWANAPRLLTKPAFLASNPMPFSMPERISWSANPLPSGINIVLMDPRKTKAAREREGELRPFVISGSGNDDPQLSGSVAKSRPAKFLNLERLLREPRRFTVPSQGFIGRSVPLDVLAASTR